MGKRIWIWILCLLCFLTGTAHGEEGLPEGLRVVADGSYPMSCKPLPEGGFLLSGLCGEPMEGSIERHIANEGNLPEETLAKQRPLSGYVAAYDGDGTQRWRYRLPAAAPYQAIFAQPLEDGRVVCRVKRYARYEVNYLDWDWETVDAFLLDQDGQYVAQLPWLTALSNEGPSIVLKWTHPMPSGILAIAPVEDFDAPYTPTLTMYDVDGRIQWRAAHRALKDYFIYLLLPVEDGYVGYGLHRSAEGAPVVKPSGKCLFKLDKQGQLLWRREYFDTSSLDRLTVRRDGSMVGSETRYQFKEGEERLLYTSALRMYDESGELLREVSLQAYSESEIYEIFEAADGAIYLVGWRRTHTEGGDSVSYNMVLRATGEGTPVDHVPLFGQAGRQTFADVIIEDGDGLYVVGAMAEEEGQDRWYILPL